MISARSTQFKRQALASFLKSELVYLALFVLASLIQTVALPSQARAQGVTGSIKGTVSAIAADASATPSLIAGARLSLVNRDTQGAALKTVTDETGAFAFLDL